MIISLILLSIDAFMNSVMNISSSMYSRSVFTLYGLFLNTTELWLNKWKNGTRIIHNIADEILRLLKQIIKMYCNRCKIYDCGCSTVVSNPVVINSDTAGRDGLSAYESAKKVGKIPSNYTEDQFVEWLKADTADVEGVLIVPARAEDIFNK